MIKCRQFKQSKAFTLVELLVAVSILVFVLAAAVKVEIDNIKLASKNEHVLVATNLAQEQLNLIKTVRDNNIKNDANKPFANFPALNTINHLVMPNIQFANGSTTKTIEPGGTVYTIEIKVLQDPPNSP